MKSAVAAPRWCLLFCLTALVCFSQEFRATLNGRVTDPAGSGVPNVKVSVKNAGTNEIVTATTNQEGDYTAPFLAPGKYQVTAEAAGFKQAVQNDLELFVNDKRTLDFKLTIGDVADTITVTEDAPLLETSTASRGGVIDNLRVTELPINGRNPFQLSALVPGVQFNGNQQFVRPFDNGANIAWSINGGLTQANEFLIDGIPDNAITDADGQRLRSQNNVAYIPPVDATQEFKIQTNFYDAQYGRTGGGVFNLLTKSGTNQFHVTAWEFLRRYQLDANFTQANAVGRPLYAIDPITGKNVGGKKLDQYGTQLTGPVFIPKFYNGRNKTFFSFGFEGYNEQSPSPALTVVPTERERNGDFSQSGVNIYDPLTTRLVNGQFVRDQFPGNVIPSTRLNPVGSAIAKSFPLPNVSNASPLQPNLVTSPNLGTDDFYSYIGRVDHSIGDRERLFFRYAYNRRDQFALGDAGITGLGIDAQDPLVRINNNAVVDSVTVLSPTTVLNLRAGLTRFEQAAYRTTVAGFDATSFGFPASFAAQRPVSITPRVDLQDYPTWGSRNPNSNITNTISLQGNLTKIIGGHSIKTGIEYRDIRLNILGGSFTYGGGYFQFTRAYTQQFGNVASQTAGSSIASLLLGAPQSGYIENVARPAYRAPYTAVYFQDDWKLSRRLSLNLGLRWDYEGSPTERFNRQNRGFGYDALSPIASAVRAATANPADCPACVNLRGGLQFAGANGQSREAFTNDLDNWQPRIGAAYQLFTKTVIRGGYGKFYLPQAVFGGTTGYSIRTDLITPGGGDAAAYIPVTSLSNPFPQNVALPIGSSQGLNTQLGGEVRFNNVDRKIPKVHQYSFGIQQQLPWSTRLEASYVGSRTVGLNTNEFNAGNPRNLNVLSPDVLATARQNPAYLTQSVQNPLAGLIPANPALNGTTIQRQRLLVPYPQFTNVFAGLEPVGRIWYDALQLQAEKRYTNGFVATLAYTFSKNLEATNFLNDQDIKPSKVLTANDRTHRVVISTVAELPFGRNRKFASKLPKAVDLLVGGWQYSAIGVIQSGVPVGYDSSVNLIGNPVVNDQSFSNYFNPCVLSVDGSAATAPNAGRTARVPCTNAVFQLRGPNTLRTIPFRSSQIRVPTRPQWDMSLNKRFNITERLNAQFRAEAFNVFNSPILGAPNTSPNSINFGFVNNAQANLPRNVQLGIKVNF